MTSKCRCGAGVGGRRHSALTLNPGTEPNDRALLHPPGTSRVDGLRPIDSLRVQRGRLDDAHRAAATDRT